MNTLGIVVLWLLAAGLLSFAALSWVAGEAERSATGSTGSRKWPGLAAVAGFVLIALLLTGCATPAVKDRIVEVKVPVAIQPITPAQVPAVPAPLGPRPSSLSAAADALLAKHCEFVAYALKADPLLRISAGLTAGSVPLFPECEGR